MQTNAPSLKLAAQPQILAARDILCAADEAPSFFIGLSVAVCLCGLWNEDCDSFALDAAVAVVVTLCMLHYLAPSAQQSAARFLSRALISLYAKPYLSDILLSCVWRMVFVLFSGRCVVCCR